MRLKLLVGSLLVITGSAASAQSWSEAQLPDTSQTVAAAPLMERWAAQGTLADVEETASAEPLSPTDFCSELPIVRTTLHDGSIIGGCGQSVVEFDPLTMAWSRIAIVPGTIRSVVPDPFRNGAYVVGTTAGTYTAAASESPVAVAGPSEDLRVVDLPMHTIIAGTFNGRASAIQATGCNINIDNVSRMPGGTPVYHAAFFRSFYRITVRTTSPDCRWAFHLSGRPPWLIFHRRSGTVVSRTSKFEEYAGSATFDVEVARNPKLLRSGSYTVSSTYPIRSDVSQFGLQGICIRRPRSTDNTPSLSMDAGQFKVFIRRWGAATPPNKAHIFRLRDDAGCVANAIPLVFSPRANGSTILPQRYQPNKDIIVTMPYATPNLTGDAALFSLRGNGGYPDEGAVATLLLPDLKALPSELQIRSQTPTSTFAAFAAQGGFIQITGSVQRASKDPNRRCAFDPALYTVVTARTASGPHFQIVPELSGCTPGDPNSGRLTIVAPSANTTGRNRLGVIFTPWGWAAFLFQPSG